MNRLVRHVSRPVPQRGVRVRGGDCGGFTLVELLVTLTVAALVVAIAVPGFQTLIRNNRLAAQANEFIAALNLTRSEAVKRRRTAVLCVETQAGGLCDPDNAQWERGWVVFVDSDDDGAIDDGEVIRRGDPLVGGNTLRGLLFGRVGQISYDSRGRLQGNDSGTFMLCDQRGAGYARVINVNGTGRAGLSVDGSNVQGGPAQCPGV